MVWAILVLFYGTVKGVREICKKKALERATVGEVLFFYSLISLLFVLPFSRDALALPVEYYGWILLKSSVIFCGWMASFRCLVSVPVGFYGVMDAAQLLFTAALGILFLKERPTLSDLGGFVLVTSALFLVRMGAKKKEGGNVRARDVLLLLFAQACNACSALMDKLFLGGGAVSSSQLQFWYILFLTVLYGIFLLVSQRSVPFHKLKTNLYIPILSLLFVLADRALFLANADSNAQVSAMAILKQSAVPVSILLGRLIYKEKQTGLRLCCAVLILFGIFLTLLS